MAPRPIHPFPARMASGLVLRAINDLPGKSVVLDPMSGSGTVMRVAVESGHVARGFDVDPMAVLLSKVGTRHVDREELIDVAEGVLAMATETPSEEVALPWVDGDKETGDFINFWYDIPQKKDLRVLAYLLSGKTGDVWDALRVAMSRLIVTKKRGASLAGDVSHSRPHRIRRMGENDFDVFPEFMKSCRWVAKKVSGIPRGTDSAIELGDARDMHCLCDASVDAVVSSPPYLNAIDYLRGHRMALVWMGHTIPKLRSIRSGSVGTARGAGPDADMPLAADLTGGCDIGGLPPGSRAMVMRYAIDIHGFVGEAARVVRPGGHVVYVVGDSLVKGTLVRNTEIVKSAARKHGLRLVAARERGIPAASRYLPPPDGGDNPIRKRMVMETVLRFAKRKA